MRAASSPGPTTGRCACGILAGRLGNLLEIACKLLPDHDLNAVSARYGISIGSQSVRHPSTSLCHLGAKLSRRHRKPHRDPAGLDHEDVRVAEGSGLLLFLSHAGADTEAARRLKQRIESAPEAQARGLKVWFDKDDLRPGGTWQSQLQDAIGEATAFAVYVGSRGVVNWVEAEVNLGLSRAISGNPRIPFIPILAREAAGSSALPGFARQFQGVREVETNPAEFQKLLAALLGGAEAGTLQLEEEPFFGLKAVDETRSHLFFGRERETEELVKRLSAVRLLMVTGDSGSGKSSLVRAGLVPRWRGGALAKPGQRADEEIWHVIETRPRGNPRRAAWGGCV